MAEFSELPNERRRKEERNRRIYELWKRGMSYSEIARVLNREAEDGEDITRQRVAYLVKRALREIGQERKEIAEEMFDGELDRLTDIVRQSLLIVNAPCRECNGQGIFGNGEVCIVCRGEGKRHDPDTRLKAMKECRAAIDQRAKMLGLYAPEKFAVTDREGNDLVEHLRREIAQMPTDDLDEQLRDFLAASDAARGE